MDMIDRMAAARTDHDESQAQLAKALGVNRVQWAKYENRTNEPPVRLVLAFCQHYSVSADYLLGLPRDLEWPR